MSDFWNNRDKLIAVILVFVFVFGLIAGSFVNGYVIVEPTNPNEQLAFDIALRLNMSSNETLYLMDLFNSISNRSEINTTIYIINSSNISLTNYTTLNQTQSIFTQLLNKFSDYPTKAELESRGYLNLSLLPQNEGNSTQVTMLVQQLEQERTLAAVKLDYEQQLRGVNNTQILQQIDELQQFAKLGKYKVESQNNDFSAMAAQIASLKTQIADSKQEPKQNTSEYYYIGGLVLVLVLCYLIYAQRGVKDTPPPPPLPTTAPAYSRHNIQSAVTQQRDSQQVRQQPLPQNRGVQNG